MTKVTINHVMSNDVKSKIFEDILGYFKIYSNRCSYHVTERPAHGAMIRHYHRPNLETDLIKPAVVTVHHDLAETDEWLHFSKYEPLYRQADLIICLNKTQEHYLSNIGIENTVVIPHGYNNKFLKPIHRHFNGQRKISLGIFSRRYPRKVKGEAYIQDLLKRLSPNQFELLFIGQDRSFDARFARKLGFQAKSFENMPYSTLCSAYGHIDMLLIASRHEGGPANIPEAVATCTPIATSRVGMAIDFVEHAVNGLHLTLDPDIDAYTLSRLYEEPQHLQALFEGARKNQNQASPWKTIVEKHEQIYIDMAENLIGAIDG